MSRVQLLGVVGLCATVLTAGAAAQTCTYGEPASGVCAYPRVVEGSPGQHMVLMDCQDAAGDGHISGIYVGNLVYFEVTPEVSGPMTVSTCHPNTLYDTVISLNQRGELCEFEMLTYSDDAYFLQCAPHCTGYTSEFTYYVAAGTTYVIIVGSYDANPQGCPLCLGLVITIGEPCGEAPRNFVCAAAYDIPGTPGTYYYNIDTTDAIGGGSWSCQSSVGHIVWFQITPDVTGDLFVNTCRAGTNYDTVIGLFDWPDIPCSGLYVQLGCQDDPGCSFVSTAAHLTAPVTAGYTYWVAVAGYSVTSGCLDLELALTEAAQPGACCFGEACYVVQTENDCDDYGGIWQGAGTECYPNPCVGPSGACCFTDGDCELFTETTCQAQSGQWLGSGTGCYPNPCPDPCAGEYTPPVAEIYSPPGLGAGCACEVDGAVLVRGSAYDPDGTFMQYVLEYRSAAGGNWETIESMSVPVIGGQLALWITNPPPPQPPIPEGYYVLRLTATNSCGMANTAVQAIYLKKGFGAVQIDYPAENGVIAGHVCLDGTVADTWCFDSFTADYRPAAGGTWQPVEPAHPAYYTTFVNQQFATWDTTGVPDGNYVIRVTGTNSCEQSLIRYRNVEVDNTAPVTVITDPVNCDAVDGTVTVIGTAADANLSQWSLYYTGGPANGWVQISYGTTNVINGVLGTWNTSALPACAYTLRLIAWDTAVQGCMGYVHQSEYDVSVTKGLGPGVVPGDLNCDGLVNVFDIDPFVHCLTTGDCDCP
jgi:hypothetical protein